MSDVILNKIKSILKHELSISKLYLFGSRTNGKASAKSDYDFVIVIKGKEPSLLEVARLKAQIYLDLKVTVDLFIYNENVFAKWEDEFGSIPETAKNTGVELPL